MSCTALLIYSEDEQIVLQIQGQRHLFYLENIEEADDFLPFYIGEECNLTTVRLHYGWHLSLTLELFGGSVACRSQQARTAAMLEWAYPILWAMATKHG